MGSSCSVWAVIFQNSTYKPYLIVCAPNTTFRDMAEYCGRSFPGERFRVYKQGVGMFVIAEVLSETTIDARWIDQDGKSGRGSAWEGEGF